jgi:hypothetical protein
MGDLADQNMGDEDATDLVREPSAPLGLSDFRQVPDRVLARIVRGDARGRSFGMPRNPRLPTLEEFNPQIAEIRAGNLGRMITSRRHGLFPEQAESIGQLSDEELIRFRPEDPVSGIESGGGLSLTGGHHRTAEIIDRVRSGRLSPDTIIRILVHD